jgi:formate dehydrogenase subunit gamma
MLQLLRFQPWMGLMVMWLTMTFAGLQPLPATAAVPHDSAVPAYAEEQTILQIEKDVPEPGLGSTASGRVHFDRHSITSQGLNREAVVLVQRGGNTWRYLRNGPLALLTGTLLIVVPLALWIFYRTVGPVLTGEKKSGRRLQRFSDWQRYVHWATAITFITLAVTGLLLLFGKVVILPLIGHNAFSWLAVVSKYVHNVVGPLFVVCSVLMFITFVWQNLFKRWDWMWIKKAGGMVSHEHVPAGYFNAGEKLWFWGGVVVLGLVMSITGLILNFVNFGQTRYILQLADYLHIAAGALYIAGSMGHSYIGSIGNPGSFEAMWTGSVSEEWAQAHHRYWYDEVTTGQPPRTVDTRPSAAPSLAPSSARPPDWAQT